MKTETKKTKKKYGRPTVINRYVLRDLKTAFSMDCTDKEACSFAGISEKTLYNYQNANPDFLQQKQGWKAQMILKAREEVAKAIETDARLAFKYLERKLPQEFGFPSVKARYFVEESPELRQAIDRIKAMK